MNDSKNEHEECKTIPIIINITDEDLFESCTMNREL